MKCKAMSFLMQAHLPVSRKNPKKLVDTFSLQATSVTDVTMNGDLRIWRYFL